jgi:hypothetical protein
MGIEQWHLYSRRRRLRHHNAAGRQTYPTIYTLGTQIRGPPTLPPPERLPEREGTNGPAGGKARDAGLLPFRLSLL